MMKAKAEAEAIRLKVSLTKYLFSLQQQTTEAHALFCSG